MNPSKSRTKVAGSLIRESSISSCGLLVLLVAIFLFTMSFNIVVFTAPGNAIHGFGDGGGSKFFAENKLNQDAFAESNQNSIEKYINNDPSPLDSPSKNWLRAQDFSASMNQKHSMQNSVSSSKNDLKDEINDQISRSRQIPPTNAPKLVPNRNSHGNNNNDKSKELNTKEKTLTKLPENVNQGAKKDSPDPIQVGKGPIPGLHEIKYGTFDDHHKRVPIVVIRSKLPPDVHERFLHSPAFNCSEDQLENFGMMKAVDYPKSAKTHFYYEGYFHTLPTRKQVFSRNPRTGKDFNKMAAGDFIRAFYQGMREVNRPLFKLLEKKLLESALQRNRLNPYNDTCGYVAKWLSKGLHFGDLSVQIHFGSAIRGDELFWHADAENSLIHFGMSVRGHRILHAKRASSPTGDVVDCLEEQNAGDVYLSASTLVNHAPEFPACTYDTRIIALHTRILYETSELKAFRAQRTATGWSALVRILADVFSSFELALPSSRHIDQIMERFKEQKI